MGAAILSNSITHEHLKQRKDITTVKKWSETYRYNGYYRSGILCMLCIMCICYVLLNDQSASCSSSTLRKRYINPIYYYYYCYVFVFHINTHTLRIEKACKSWTIDYCHNNHSSPDKKNNKYFIWIYLHCGIRSIDDNWCS